MTGYSTKDDSCSVIYLFLFEVKVHKRTKCFIKGTGLQGGQVSYSLGFHPGGLGLTPARVNKQKKPPPSVHTLK